MKDKITKCLVLGGEGMLGHMIVKYIKALPEFEVSFTTRNEKKGIYFDAYQDFDKIIPILDKVKPDLVINCIGVVPSFINKSNKGMVVFLNSYLPYRLATVCRLSGAKLFHISTDCVFSGEEGNYTEESNLTPTDFYGLTKATGEVNDDYHLTIRTSIIGPELNNSKNGLMEWFLSQKNKEVGGYTGVIWSGVTTLELAKKIIEMYDKEVTGLINIISKPISKYDLLCLIKKVYGLKTIIKWDDKIDCDRSMKSVRKDVNYIVPTHEEMLKELKEFGEKNVQ